LKFFFFLHSFFRKEEKLFVMIMKDAGKSAEDISHGTGVSKSNVEKWCSDKVSVGVFSVLFGKEPRKF
jgi:transposase